jgi:protein phosphatase
MVSALYYQRQCRLWNEIVPGVWIGGILNEKEAQTAIENGVTTVIDLTTEFSEAKPLLDQKYFNFKVLDLTAPSLNVLQQSVKLIDEYQKKGVVYIHCKIGYSRSAAVAGAYLLYTGKEKTVKDAVNHLRMIRKSIVVRPEILRVLEAYLKSIKSPHSKDMASLYKLEYKKAI